MHCCPTRRVFSGTGLELVTRQATIQYLYHSGTMATCFGKKTMLCVSWDQSGIVYYELLKPNDQKTWQNDFVTQQHSVSPVKNTLKSLGWDILPHPPYSPDLATSVYPLFTSMGHTLAEQHFSNFEDAGKWLDEWVVLNSCWAAVAEWYRYRTVACFVTGSSPVPPKTRRVGQRCTLNLSRAETSSHWCGS
ncbi:mariner Mos1 transposase [Trichonephila clavipes]|uniref:Mariner Mos1 transposase n=1 Tax=Trichonephila clavipes TaxID=2585209 RepID=A0A8X6VHK4_TRICX|nr:mariner Mos1 transposase [Trichonephila clavipes]